MVRCERMERCVPQQGLSAGSNLTAGLKQQHGLKPWCMVQVLVPGKQNYSLAITWSLDYDPVKTVRETLNGGQDEEPEEASGAESGSHGGEALPAELGAALLARRSLRMRKSQSLQDAVRLINSFSGQAWPPLR